MSSPLSSLGSESSDSIQRLSSSSSDTIKDSELTKPELNPNLEQIDYYLTQLQLELNQINLNYPANRNVTIAILNMSGLMLSCRDQLAHSLERTTLL